MRALRGLTTLRDVRIVARAAAHAVSQMAPLGVVVLLFWVGAAIAGMQVGLDLE